MGTYEALKQAITNTIKQNGNAEITGDLLQQVLLAIVSNIGKGSTFAGIAIPSTNPGTPDNNTFYLAAKSGTYANFGGLVLDNQLAVISNKSGVWVAEKVDIATSDALVNMAANLRAEIQTTSQSVAIERARATARENAIEAMFTQPVVEAINEWLQAHPEATTSVLDNSISQQKLTEEVRQRVNYAKNVLEYPGANFTEKLQAAMDDTVDAPRIFFIPPGSYTIEQRIDVPADARPFKLMGQPSFTTFGKSIITCHGSFLNIENVVSVDICDLALLGNNTGKCIDTNYVRWAKFDRLFIRGFEVGVVFDSPYGVMSRVEVSECKIGVQITPVGTIMRDCHIHGNSDIGIQVNDGNSLLIAGIIMEQKTTAKHIEINNTSTVVITGSYIGDDSAMWLQNNGGTHIVVTDMLSSIGGPNELVEVNGGDVKLNGRIYDINGGIKVNSGTLDISETFVNLAKQHINNVNGFVVGEPAQYMKGYSLHQVADDTCPIAFWGVIEDVESVNFAGNKVLGINSQQVSYNPNVDVNKPGIKYHFQVSRRFIGKQIYLNMGIDRTATTTLLDCWIVGCTLNPQPFHQGTFNNVEITESYRRIRFNTDVNYWSLPIIPTSEDIYISICNFAAGGQRNIKFKVNFIYISEDNKMVIPPDWKPDNKTSGTTDERPTEAKEPGFMYFDTTLSKPIYWSGTAWVDASGNVV